MEANKKTVGINQAIDLLHTVAVVRDGSEKRFDEALTILREIKKNIEEAFKELEYDPHPDIIKEILNRIQGE